MRVGLAQIAPRLGDVDANIEKHLQYVDRAVAEGCDVVLFPELSLTGYFLEDLVYEVAIDPWGSKLNPLLERSRDISIVIGFVEQTPDHSFKIAAAYAEEGRIIHIHRKVYLVTYGLFDEGRFLGAGDVIRAFDSSLGRQAVLICEDLWHPTAAAIAALDGADVIHGIACSPGRGVAAGGRQLGSVTTWEHINRMYAQMLVCYRTYCNRVGYEDGVNFSGGSEVIGPDGDVVAKAGGVEEELVVADLTASELRRARIKMPLRRDEP